MATKISILETGEALDVSEGMNVEFKITSPLFSDQGSQTISDTLPDTPKNRRILGFPGRVDSVDRVQEKTDVLVEDGSFQRYGELAVQGSDKGIQFNVGLDEGIMYAFFKNKTIKELETFPVMEFGENLDVAIGNCWEFLSFSRANKTTADMTVFPVMLYKGDNASHDFVPNRYEWNSFQQQYLLVVGPRTVTQMIDGVATQVSVPNGYGISPYPRVWKILEIIFENFGYTILENPFKDDFHLKLLTSLHNCVDVICMGKIDYRHIMPDVKIQDFLDALTHKFGALFYVNSNDRTVRVRLIRNVLTSKTDKDYTRYKSGKLLWLRTPPKQLRLKMKTGFDRATPPAETYEEFVAQYNNVVSEVYTTNIEGSSKTDRYVMIYDLSTGDYYRQQYIGTEKKRTWLGSDFFNWDKKHSIDYEDYEAVDECVPTIRTGIFPNTIPYYPAGYSHVNTGFKSSAGKSENKESKSPLAFVFYWGIQSLDSNTDPMAFYAAGSFNRRNHFGHRARDLASGQDYRISLTARSLYENYLKDWDKVLRYSNQEYKGNFAFSKVECLFFDNLAKLMIDNQEFLPAELNFALGSLSRKKEVGLVVRSLKPLSPYDFSELDLPVVSEQQYYWAMVDLFEATANQVLQDLKDRIDNEEYSVREISRERLSSPTFSEIDWFFFSKSRAI